MNIISKHKDYYDNILAYGRDENLYFNRKNVFVESSQEMETHISTIFNLGHNYKHQFLRNNAKIVSYNDNSYYRSVREPLEASSHFIGFCGRMIPTIKLSVRYNQETYIKYCYSLEQVISFLEKHADKDKEIKKELTKFKEAVYKNNNKKHHWMNKINAWSIEGVEKFFESYNRELPIEMFYELKVPYFIVPLYRYQYSKFKDNYISSDTLEAKIKNSNYSHVSTYDMVEINPILKDLDFAGVVDPFTAFQEISMFLSGVLGINEPEMIEISDKHKRDAKGFDDKSFKTRSKKNK